jgi:hypothetical protein
VMWASVRVCAQSRPIGVVDKEMLSNGPLRAMECTKKLSRTGVPKRSPSTVDAVDGGASRRLMEGSSSVEVRLRQESGWTESRE